jgi:hypothetical protein
VVAAVAGAGTARATEVSVRVVNGAAPGVTIVAPRDGATLPAGQETRVVVSARDADGVEMTLDGAAGWSGAGPLLSGAWTPAPGSHRLVAVAHRDGAPDAIDAVTVSATASEPEAAAHVPPGAGPGTPARGPRTGAPASHAPARADRGRARRPSAASPARPTAPAAPAGRASREGEGDGWGWASPLGAVLRFLSSPERAAWTAAFPLLLIMAAFAYALLQRFIDGGDKLAFRGRGRPQDEVVEF